MAIRLKREGRKRYLETDTIADWVEALSMGLPIKGPPAFAKLFGTLPDNLDDFDSVEEILAWADKRREEIIAAEENREKMILAEIRRRRQLRRERTPLYGQRRRGQRGKQQASS